MVHASEITLFEFRDQSKSAIENIHTAIKQFKAKPSIALIILERNKDIANKMELKAKALMNDSLELSTMTGTAIEKSSETYTNVVNEARLTKI